MAPHPPKDHLHTHTRPRHRTASLVAVGVVGLSAAIGIAVSVGGDEPAPTPMYVETGETSAMGVPVIETPGGASGTADAGTVAVTGSSWELGTVPLDVTVRPTWVLRNTGPEPVEVGEPHPEVRSGCCPGAFTIDSTSIPPGEAATLGFELSMHAGMDGWHDIAVHVPVRTADGGDHVLELEVTGDFTNA